MRNMITLQDILGMNSCYSDTHIHELWAEHAGDRESIKPSEIVGVIPDKDALWILCHLAPERIAIEVACDWAERALLLVPDTSERSWQAIAVARRYACGEATQDELRAASAAAWVAADAVWTGASNTYAAAWAAVRATEAVAWDAAMRTARAAPWDDSTAPGRMLLDLVERMEGA